MNKNNFSPSNSSSDEDSGVMAHRTAPPRNFHRHDYVEEDLGAEISHEDISMPFRGRTEAPGLGLRRPASPDRFVPFQGGNNGDNSIFTRRPQPQEPEPEPEEPPFSYYTSRSQSPVHRTIINMCDIIDEPGRSERPER